MNYFYGPKLKCNDLEAKQNEMGRWLSDVVNVKNELIRGETGWSTFEEREAKAMASWLLRILFKMRIKCLIWVEHVS